MEGKNTIVKTFQKFYIYIKFLLFSDLNSTFYLVYTTVAIASFVFPIITPLLMLFIFKKLNIANDILKAVTGSARSLLVILLIFLIISYDFALMVYYNYFEDYPTECTNFWNCFIMVVDSTFKFDGGFISQANKPDGNFKNI